MDAASGRPHPGAQSPRRWIGAALVLGAATLWATFGLFAKHFYSEGYSAVELASVRATLGFAGFAGYALISLLRRHTRGSVRIPMRAVPFFALYGVLGFALFELIFFLTFDHTTVSIAVALLYTAPAFVVLLSALLWREQVGRARMIAVVLALMGVALVTGAAGSILRGDAPITARALQLGLASGVGYAFYTMFSKVATNRYGAFASLFWSFGFAALALAFVAPPLEPLLRSRTELPWMIALGIIPTIAPYALYLAGLRALRASTAAMLASLEPVVAALLAAALLHERLDGLQTAGMALVVCAALLIARTDNGGSGVTEA